MTAPRPMSPSELAAVQQRAEAALRRIDDVIDRPCSVTEREVVEIARAALATDGDERGTK